VVDGAMEENLKTRERLDTTRSQGGHDSKIVLVRSI
jgi:hypothetical protein